MANESQTIILIEIYNKSRELLDFFFSADWGQGVLPFIKLFAAVFSLFLFVLIVIVSVKSDRLWKLKMARESSKVIGFPKHFDKKWQIVARRMAKGDEANVKLAVIEADKLLDIVLQHMNLAGKDMGERLEKIDSSQLSNLEDIWLAHKVRNRIVHEPEHHLTRSEAESAIAAYEKAFKEWQVL